jgi:hypothetical protein
VELAAVIAVMLLTLVTAFQAALALGAPLGRAAWSGKHPGVLPPRLRVASGVAALVIYPLIMFVVLAAGGLIGWPWSSGTARIVMWALAGLFALGAAANAASRSSAERIWAPVALGVAVCCAVIARAL